MYCSNKIKLIRIEHFTDCCRMLLLWSKGEQCSQSYRYMQYVPILLLLNIHTHTSMRFMLITNKTTQLAQQTTVEYKPQNIPSISATTRLLYMWHPNHILNQRHTHHTLISLSVPLTLTSVAQVRDVSIPNSGQRVQGVGQHAGEYRPPQQHRQQKVLCVGRRWRGVKVKIYKVFVTECMRRSGECASKHK